MNPFVPQFISILVDWFPYFNGSAVTVLNYHLFQTGHSSLDGILVGIKEFGLNNIILI